jgi:hypothetical protein
VARPQRRGARDRAAAARRHLPALLDRDIDLSIDDAEGVFEDANGNQEHSVTFSDFRVEDDAKLLIEIKLRWY